MNVSVCIATYNGAKYVKDQINSILPQLSDYDEIIISDDGSIDNTIDIIYSINDDRIQIVQNQGEHGYTSNFENALMYSTGDILVLSDQDDIWMPNKIALIKQDLLFADLVITDAKVTDEDLNIVAESFWELSSPHRSLLGNLIRFSYLGCCMAFKRSVLNAAIPFPKKHLMATHDNWISLIGLALFRVKFESKPLILYRRHQNNTSNGCLSHSTNSIWFMISYRLYLIWSLFWRFLLIIRNNNFPNKCLLNIDKKG